MLWQSALFAVAACLAGALLLVAVWHGPTLQKCSTPKLRWLVLAVLLCPPAFGKPGRQLQATQLSITVSEGLTPGRVSWSLDCDGATLSGGAPFSGSLQSAVGAACSLEMSVLGSNGWNGAEWRGEAGGPPYGPFALPSGSSGVEVFELLPPPPPPPPPPQPPQPQPPQPQQQQQQRWQWQPEPEEQYRSREPSMVGGDVALARRREAILQLQAMGFAPLQAVALRPTLAEPRAQVHVR